MPQTSNSNQSLDDYLKEIGAPAVGKMAAQPAPVPGEAVAATSEDPHRAGHVPEPDELDWQQRAGRGVAKEGASLLTGAGRLAGKGIGLFSPKLQERLGDIAERVPGVKQMEEFAAEPYQSFAEGVGGTALDVFAPFATPEIGVGRGLATLASKVAPTAGFARGVGVVPTTWGRVAGLGSTAAESAAKGAIGGAVSNPDDPATGAEIGAAAGAVSPAIGGALRTPQGQFVGGALSRQLAGAALPAAIGGGIGYHHGGVGGGIEGALAGGGLHALGHSIRSYHSPFGRWLNRFGRAAFDRTGRFIGYIHPMTGGIIAGHASDGSIANPFTSSEEGGDGQNSQASAQ